MTSRTIAIDAIELKAADLSLRVGVASIRQIIPAIGLMRVPLSRPQVAGVVARDGRAIPVYRLQSLAETLVGAPTQEAPPVLAHVTRREGVQTSTAASGRRSDFGSSGPRPKRTTRSGRRSPIPR